MNQERVIDNRRVETSKIAPEGGEIVDKCFLPGSFSLFSSWKMKGDISLFLTLGARRLVIRILSIFTVIQLGMTSTVCADGSREK